MKSREENKALLVQAVKRLMAYPLERRKQLFLKGMAMSMAKLKDNGSLVDVSQAKSLSNGEYPQEYPAASSKAPGCRGTQPGTHGK